MKVIEFLNNAKVYYLATVDGDQPHVRPIGFVMDYKDQLVFSTDARKKMCNQIKKNPKVEISAIDENMNILRLTGKVRFITDTDSQTAAINAFPLFGQMYTVGDSNFEIYTLDEIEISYTTMTGKKLDGIEL
ncbi:pyridoxamine 5-phosphate oxidase [Peptostreptococcus anaerobius]|uniref:Pyridoxamine 5-phosphate oxidase n=1 Tax=Peptostreptococcus porci TaxID=2652282 RepID=A0A6N7X0Q6_9FIRM|nr:pyridoxamine 5'-phosphate oxidase family protein [Peptostreptococcus porci]MDD7182909.1 pyridoxamine 5'-phosphate oxidase family protein [Peptostreptococcus porci]MDY4129503.1 pyridoxamine 5'-phosphate oxidase family protein [Peptostreptococcus porci]MST61711.1 pyridoxamine 5-phosphate oxidase [Peptostreptococcus porci]